MNGKYEKKTQSILETDWVYFCQFGFNWLRYSRSVPICKAVRQD